ncbi:MAG TPA: hypothetical protein VK886_16975 [Vicinamibacterales bacterium]|nr:hypothetical protein [Vicinamibacterales bacterium]
MTGLALIAAAAALLTAGASVGQREAARADETLTQIVYGEGGDSCDKWLTGERAIEAAQKGNSPDDSTLLMDAYRRRAWLSGYVTAADDPLIATLILGREAERENKPGRRMPVDSLLRPSDGAAMRSAMRQYCEAHPTKTVAQAAAEAVVIPLVRP